VRARHLHRRPRQSAHALRLAALDRQREPGARVVADDLALGRHLGKHIPGQPAIILHTQPAASGLAAAAALCTTDEKDGATISSFPNNFPMGPLFGHPGVRYDALKLNWLGSIGKLQNVCATWHTGPIKTIAQASTR
jgi:hypothetical protein